MSRPDRRVVALIPARGGSQRIPRKNIRLLGGQSLIVYTIAAARASDIFTAIYVSTEDTEIATVAARAGAEIIWRPPALAISTSPDIEWVEHALGSVATVEAFALLRPTSPFRKAATIRRAWAELVQRYDVDSLRAVEPVRSHPGKMWTVCQVTTAGEDGPPRELLRPYDDFGLSDPPAHSRATQSLPPVWQQNASLEMAWTQTVREQRSISGERIMPFYTQGYEGFDLNAPNDWTLAEALLARGMATLPEV